MTDKKDVPVHDAQYPSITINDGKYALRIINNVEGQLCFSVNYEGYHYFPITDDQRMALAEVIVGKKDAEDGKHARKV